MLLLFLEFSGYRRMPNAFPDEISAQTVAKRARQSRLKPIFPKCLSLLSDLSGSARYRISGSILGSNNQRKYTLMIVLCFLESMVVSFFVLQTKSRCVDKKATYTLIRMIKFQLHLFVTPANAQVENLSQNEGGFVRNGQKHWCVDKKQWWTKNHMQTKSHCSVQETLTTLHVQCLR